MRSLRHILKNKRVIYIIIGGVLLCLFALLFLYKIEIKNEKGQPVASTIQLFIGDISFWSIENKSSIYIPLSIGVYKIRINATGYQPVEQELKNFNILKKQVKDEIEIQPIILTISSYAIYDPTETLRLSPFAEINGVSILGEEIHMRGVTEIPYGTYEVLLADPHFRVNLTLIGDTFYRYGQPLSSIRMEPGDATVWLADEEVMYTIHYLQDFLNLSAEGYIEVDAGFPKQFYLRRPGIVLSLGDMIFLFCQFQTYQETQQNNTIFFVPVNKKYTFVDDVFHGKDCYAHGLAGYIPKKINATSIAKLFGNYSYDLISNTALNTKQRFPISFTFDIESGRYVQSTNKGAHALSPCTNNVTKIGLEQETENICDDPDFAGWFSAIVENSQELPYPWVSGIRGTEELVKWSTAYGIPLTFFIVSREVPVYEALAPELPEEIKALVAGDMIEIASHTQYHTKLGAAPVEKDIEQLQVSKKFLEDTFQTAVIGFRGPYFSFVGNNILGHEQALKEAGYTYYSNEWVEKTGLPSIVHKPVNFYFLSEGNQTRLVEVLSSHGYMITIDHPWNIYYSEKEYNEETYLQEDDEKVLITQATMLFALSEGGIPMKLAEMDGESFR